MRLSWILPGRLAASGMIGRTDLNDLEEQGVSAILSLTLRSPFPDEAPDGFEHLHLPVPDMSCPTGAAVDRAVRFLRDTLDAGGRALVHCGAGYGRTGTVIACYLVSQGMGPDDALHTVRSARPGSVETREQEQGILAYARRLREDGHG